MKPLPELLAFEGVSGRYGDNSIVALDSVSFLLEDCPGLVVVAGPNGSGKTTLLRLVAGQLPALRGRIRLAGIDVTDLPTHKRPGLAWLFQRSLEGMCASLTIEENLSLGLMGHRPSLVRRLLTPDRRKRIARLAGTAASGLAGGGGILGRLEEVLARFPTEFSGGEIQQISMLGLLLREPPATIVLADEPTLNLDKENRRACLSMLGALAERGVVLLATHDRELIDRCARRLLLDSGRLVEDSTSPW